MIGHIQASFCLSKPANPTTLQLPPAAPITHHTPRRCTHHGVVFVVLPHENTVNLRVSVLWHPENTKLFPTWVPDTGSRHGQEKLDDIDDPVLKPFSFVFKAGICKSSIVFMFAIFCLHFFLSSCCNVGLEPDV